jgi:predicted DNA-binding transcriptional regulator AlpA
MRPTREAEFLIVGLNAIGRAVGRSRSTLWRWILWRDFPAARLPDGRYATTSTWIDAWLQERRAKDPYFRRDYEVAENSQRDDEAA